MTLHTEEKCQSQQHCPFSSHDLSQASVQGGKCSKPKQIGYQSLHVSLHTLPRMQFDSKNSTDQYPTTTTTYFSTNSAVGA